MGLFDNIFASIIAVQRNIFSGFGFGFNPPPPPPAPKPKDTNLDESEKAQVTTFFTNLVNQKVAYANDQITQVNDVFNKIGKTLLSNTQNLNANINQENKLIDYQIEENNSKINMSSVVKWKYEQDSLSQLKYQNYILFIIFYILVLVLGTVMYFYSSSNMAVQATIFHILLIWPFLIYYLELFLYIIYSYLYSYSYGVPYNKVYVGDY